MELLEWNRDFFFKKKKILGFFWLETRKGGSEFVGVGVEKKHETL